MKFSQWEFGWLLTWQLGIPHGAERARTASLPGLEYENKFGYTSHRISGVFGGSVIDQGKQKIEDQKGLGLGRGWSLCTVADSEMQQMGRAITP